MLNHSKIWEEIRVFFEYFEYINMIALDLEVYFFSMKKQ